MTRYEELSSLAVKFTKELFEDKSSCLQCALQLQVAFLRYLEAPPEAVSFVTLDSDLRKVDDEGMNLRLGPDRKWYFGISFHFESRSSMAFQDVIAKFGIQSENDGFRIYYDQDFYVDTKDKHAFQPVVAFVYKGFADDFAKPLYTPRTRLGF